MYFGVQVQKKLREEVISETRSENVKLSKVSWDESRTKHARLKLYNQKNSKLPVQNKVKVNKHAIMNKIQNLRSKIKILHMSYFQ